MELLTVEHKSIFADHIIGTYKVCLQNVNFGGPARFNPKVALMPVTAKRKRTLGNEEKQDLPSISNNDISLALLGKRQKNSQAEVDNDDDLSSFIQTSIAERSIKEGTRIVKKAIGKEKVAKGEVGGGSFQSMGKWPFMISL